MDNQIQEVANGPHLIDDDSDDDSDNNSASNREQHRDGAEQSQIRMRSLLAPLDEPEYHYRIAMRCLNGEPGFLQSTQEAIMRLERATNCGHPLAPQCLAFMYYRGQYGLPRRLDVSARLYKLSADRGSAEAQYMLGFFYQRGRGVEKDLEAAAKYLWLAADQKIPDAQKRVCRLQNKVMFVPSDHNEAFRYFGMAAAMGDPIAASKFSLIYHDFGPEVQDYVLLKQEMITYSSSNFLRYYTPSYIRGRGTICEWLFKVVDHFDLDRLVVFYTMSYIDRYVWTTDVTKNFKSIQLLAVGCFAIALKLHLGSVFALNGKSRMIESLMLLCREYFTAKDVAWMELAILEHFKWRMHPPTLHLFIKRYMETLSTNDGEVYNLSVYFAEISLLFEYFIAYKPSEIALAAVLNAIDELSPDHDMNFSQSFTHYGLSASDPAVAMCRERLMFHFADFQAA